MDPQLLDRLTAHGQQHLLTFWDELSDVQRADLLRQIESIDFDLVTKLYARRDQQVDVLAWARRAEEPPAFRLGDPSNRIAPAEAIRRGQEALAGGEVAVLLVAGGQGTRLGFDHPKGMYPVGPVSQATLFQIHVEKVVALGRRHGARIPLCVMTSSATHEETIAFFDEHGRFGLPADDLLIFRQGTMPAVDAQTGRVLLAEKDAVSLSPDGHGGMLAALERSGVLKTLGERGIRQLFYLQVDNPLVDIGSPELLGYHLLAGSELTSEVVRKHDPLDRVGNVVAVDGRLHVIEYSDLPDDLARQRTEDGRLRIWAGSIAIHVMDVSFLRRMADTADSLPFHIALKKVTYINPDGEKVKPNEPNAVKFERFIFDLLPSARNAVVVEVDPRDHFAPLKNASGAPNDTPESVRAGIADLHRRWLRAAGVQVPDDLPIEISPLFALDADEVRRRVEPGLILHEPTYFRP